MSDNKVYTRTGDKGTTSLIGGRRVPKYDDKVEAYGAVDELSAFMGVLQDAEGTPQKIQEVLAVMQRCLLTLESLLALDNDAEIRKMMPTLADSDIKYVEDRIDEISEQLPPLRAFVIPGGNRLASHAHVCRTVCRRAERRAWKLASHEEVDILCLTYLNRLSDFFFVLSRYFVNLGGDTESGWDPKE